tara:strand:- start:165 stop:797 length:633 start_codon:yes stop_codon:yes gene_type:complete
MHKLFGFPVGLYHISPNSYDKNSIVNPIETNYNKSETRNNFDNLKSNIHCEFRDTDTLEFLCPDYKKELLPLYSECVEKYLSGFSWKENFSYKLTISNYIALKSGQFMKRHYHNNADFTGVHYLKYDNTHITTNYENDRGYVPWLRDFSPNLFYKLDNNNIDNSWAFEDYRINVKEDDFCIVPAVLPHSVPVQKTDSLRITIVIDVKIKK